MIKPWILKFSSKICLNEFWCLIFGQLTGAVKYSNCISAEGWDPPTPIKYPEYDIKPSDDEASALQLWEIWRTSSLLLLPGPLWPWMVALDGVLSMGQIELFNHLNCLQINDMLKWIVRNRTVWQFNGV